MKFSFLSIIFASAFALLSASIATAEITRFNNPMHGGNRLDWCFAWAQGCGEQAADAWCVARNYDSATGWAIANDIGPVSPTRNISNGAVCDQAFCDGFNFIDCTRPDPTQTFNNPMHGGNRLDWCFAWAQGCGEQAADAWCVQRGFARADAWAIAQDIGPVSPTRNISNGAVCDQAFCDGFSSITCAQ